MLASISPLGERARGNRWSVTATAYVVGSTLAGALVGALAGAAGRAIGPTRTVSLVIVGVLAASAGAAELAGLPLPSVHRQVDEDWLTRYRGWVYGLGFGTQLGLGVVTIVTTATVYAWMGAAVAAASIGGGALVGTAFGLSRALPLLTVGRVGDPQGLRALMRRFTAIDARVRVFAGVIAVAVAVVAWAGA